MSLQAILVACGCGALVALQAPLLGVVGQRAGGTLQAAALAFLVGAAVIVAQLLLWRLPAPQLRSLRGLPTWAWLGCFTGIGVLLCSLQLVPRIGAARFAVASLVGQCVASVALDHFGAFGLPVRTLDVRSTTGVVLALTGMILVILNRP
jgi:transporter family-2 protein